MYFDRVLSGLCLFSSLRMSFVMFGSFVSSLVLSFCSYICVCGVLSAFMYLCSSQVLFLCPHAVRYF